jgi:polar amino acid transport system substrate-binding protein
VVADITRELERRAGVPVTIPPPPTAAAVLEAVRTGSADIGFVAPNPQRTGVVLYSQTYMLVQQSALARTDSPLHSVGELDRPGQIIGINTDDSVGVWLQERLTAARLHTTPDYTLRDAVRLQDGTVVAFAGDRQRLTSGTQNVRGLRLRPRILAFRTHVRPRQRRAINGCCQWNIAPRRTIRSTHTPLSTRRL